MSTDWTQYAGTVEVPTTSEKIVYEILLNGTGQVWMNWNERPGLDVWHVPIEAIQQENRRIAARIELELRREKKKSEEYEPLDRFTERMNQKATAAALEAIDKDDENDEPDYLVPVPRKPYPGKDEGSIALPLPEPPQDEAGD